MYIDSQTNYYENIDNNKREQIKNCMESLKWNHRTKGQQTKKIKEIKS